MARSTEAPMDYQYTNSRPSKPAWATNTDWDSDNQDFTGVVKSGRYIITNVRFKIVAVLHGNDTSDIVAGPLQNIDNEKWDITRLSNEKYTIKNVFHANFANSKTRSRSGEYIYGGKNSNQQWDIRETNIKGNYTISPSDSDVFWGLANGGTHTPITFSTIPNDPKNRWTLQKTPATPSLFGSQAIPFLFHVPPRTSTPLPPSWTPPPYSYSTAFPRSEELEDVSMDIHPHVGYKSGQNVQLGGMRRKYKSTTRDRDHRHYQESSESDQDSSQRTCRTQQAPNTTRVETPPSFVTHSYFSFILFQYLQVVFVLCLLSLFLFLVLQFILSHPALQRPRVPRLGRHSRGMPRNGQRTTT